MSTKGPPLGGRRYQFAPHADLPGHQMMQYLSVCGTVATWVAVTDEMRHDRQVIAFNLRGLRYEARRFKRRRDYPSLAALFPGLGTKVKRRPLK